MRSQAEILLAEQLRQAGIPFESEYRFAPPRRFRADFYLNDWNLDGTDILIEVEGGTWTSGRHVTGLGFERDCEKQALAVIRGYRYLRVTSAQVNDGTALEWVRQALGVAA